MSVQLGPGPPEASRQRTDVNTDGYLVSEFEQSGRQKTRFRSDTCPAEMLNTGVDLILDCSLASVYNVPVEISISPQPRRLFKCYRLKSGIKLIEFFNRNYDTKLVLADEN